MKHLRGRRGFTLIEAMVACVICLIIVLSVVGAFSLSLRASLNNVSRVQAAFLEEEGIEAVRILRDNGWTANITTKATSTAYYLYFNGATWVSTSTNTYIDSLFERKFVIDPVYRNGSNNIASSGTLDPNMRKATVTVSWKQGKATSTRSLATYLGNTFAN